MRSLRMTRSSVNATPGNKSRRVKALLGTQLICRRTVRKDYAALRTTMIHILPLLSSPNIPSQTLLPPLRFTHLIFHATSLRRSLKVSLGFESPQAATFNFTHLIEIRKLQKWAWMTCVKEGRGRRWGYNDPPQGSGSKRKMRMAFMEICFGVTFWQTAQAREGTFVSLQQELLGVKGELTDPPNLKSHRFLLYFICTLPFASN